MSNILNRIKTVDGVHLPSASPIPRRKDSQRIYNAIRHDGEVVSFGFNSEGISEYMNNPPVKVKKPSFIKTELLKSMLK